MKRKLLAALFLSAVFAFAQAPAPTAANVDLAGLWKAKRISAGLRHQRIIITRSGGGYRADVLGWNLPVKNERGSLSFAVTNGEGSFRGRVEKNGGITGFWTR